MESTTENTNTTGRKELSGPASTVIAAVIGGIFGIVIALIGIYPNLRQGTGITEGELREQILQSIPAPKESKIWVDQDKKTHRYWACSGYPDWNEAETFCESIGGHLVTITSKQEQSFLESFIKDNAAPNTCIWIGIQSNNKLWNKWITQETFGEYSNWNETFREKFIEKHLYYGNSPAISNYWDEFTFRYNNSNDNDSFTTPISHGQWVIVKNSNPDGWLICEWDYD